MKIQSRPINTKFLLSKINDFKKKTKLLFCLLESEFQEIDVQLPCTYITK